jgi:hypothetical protein
MDLEVGSRQERLSKTCLNGLFDLCDFSARKESDLTSVLKIARISTPTLINKCEQVLFILTLVF